MNNNCHVSRNYLFLQLLESHSMFGIKTTLLPASVGFLETVTIERIITSASTMTSVAAQTSPATSTASVYRAQLQRNISASAMPVLQETTAAQKSTNASLIHVKTTPRA